MTKEKILKEFFIKRREPIGYDSNVSCVDGKWYAPKFGCDTLGMLLDNLKEDSMKSIIIKQGDQKIIHIKRTKTGVESNILSSIKNIKITCIMQDNSKINLSQ